jgi:hypothetical protein
MVLDASDPVETVLEVKIDGEPTAVRLYLESTGAEVPMHDDGTSGDAVAGDDVYTVVVAPEDVLHDFTDDDVHRNFIGYVRLYIGEDLQRQYNTFFDILTDAVPPVKIGYVSDDIQYTRHLVNIVYPAFFDDFLRSDVCRRFYEEFGDDYDFLNLIYGIGYFMNRFHAGISNDVQGIGKSIYNGASSYGSDGRLKGMSVFPIPGLFDGAEPAYQHELGHQWINFLPVPPLDYAIAHWPLSDLASGIMGYATRPGGQGLNFNFDLVPDGNDYIKVRNHDPKVFKDLDLYLMGLIGPDEVADHFVFDDQNQTSGWVLHGPVTTVTIDDIISHVGPRVPDHTVSQKVFNIASIIVSKDALLSEDTMRLYDFFSARAEGTEIVRYSSGFAKGLTKPFYLSTQGTGQIDAGIKGPETSCDFVEDGRLDMKDIEFIVSRWLHSCTEPGWCAGVDADRNESVDFYDFASCAKYYGL